MASSRGACCDRPLWSRTLGRLPPGHPQVSCPRRRYCNMARVKLTVIGCSPAWPNPGGAHSGYLLEGGGTLLLDCGPGVLSRLRERAGWPALDALAITHFDLDHWGDLVPWVWGALSLGELNPARPELWLPPGGRAVLAEFRGGFVGAAERVFALREYEPGVPFEAAGFTVTAMRMPHYAVEAYGFRVSDGASTLAYSGDSAACAELAELARGADLFLCEATLPSGAGNGDQLRGHLTLEEAQAAFSGSRAKRLIVTHRPVELEANGCELARDGLVVEL